MTDAAAEGTMLSPDVKPAADAPTQGGRSSTRKRKQADFFVPDAVKKTDKLVMKEGEGTKLGDIPNVAFHISKITGRDELMEQLHHLLFKSKGKLSTRKREILGFSGIVYEAGKEDERAKYAERLGRWKLEDINRSMDIMDVPRGSGTKDAKIGALLDFLEKPKVMRDTDLAEKEAKKKQKKEKAKSAKKPAAKGRKKAAKKEEDDDDDDEGEEEDDNDDEEEAAEEEEEAPAPKKQKAPAAKKKAEAQPKKRKAPAEAAAPRKKRAAKEPKAAAAAEPSDAELAAEIRAIVADVDLEAFSRKDLLQRLEAKFGVSLKARKDFIKETASAAIEEKGAPTAMQEDEAEEAEEPKADEAEAEEPKEPKEPEAEEPKAEEGEAKAAEPEPAVAGETAAEPAAEEAVQAADAMEEDAPAAAAEEAPAEAAAPEAPAAAPQPQDEPAQQMTGDDVAAIMADDNHHADTAAATEAAATEPATEAAPAPAE